MSKELENRSYDYVAMAAKAALGTVPFVGSLLAELAGTIIPNQRIDRVAKFASILEERLSKLEKEKLQLKISDPECADLLEEAMRQSASSLSDERREYIASLIANSISTEEISHQESKHLLRMLGELNDIEIIWLRNYADALGENDEFYEKHKAILSVKPIYTMSPQSDIDNASLTESYKNHLVRLNLLEEDYDMDSKTNQLKLDNRGRIKIKSRNLTDLGRLMLKSIGALDKT